MAVHRAAVGQRSHHHTWHTAAATLVLFGLAAMAVKAAPAAQRWITFTDEPANLNFDYPAGLFTEEKGDPTAALGERSADRVGRIFASPDGTAILQFGTFPNSEDVSVEDLRKRAIAASYADAKIEYNRVTDNWYVLSGKRGSDTFYERVQFSCRGKRLDLFALTYPTAQASLYDEVVDEMARRVRPTLARIRCPGT